MFKFHVEELILVENPWDLEPWEIIDGFCFERAYFSIDRERWDTDLEAEKALVNMAPLEHINLMMGRVLRGLD